MLRGRIVRATLTISFFSLLSKILGLLREMVIARQFGASADTDAYNVALGIPMILFTIISGALAPVVVPVFVSFVTRGDRREAWRIFSGVFNIIALVFLVLSLVGVVLAPFLIHLVAPKFSGTTEMLATELTRIIFPILPFMGLASLFTGLLNANNIFAIPALSNSVNNIMIIASAFILGSLYGIHGLVAGTVLAMGCMALVQLPPLLRLGFRFSLRIPINHPEVKRIYRLALPVAFALIINQIPVVVKFILSSGLAAGSLSSLNYADKLIQFPLALFALALGTAAFPTLSEHVARNDRIAATETIAKVFKLTVLTAFPAACGLIVLANPIVKLFYEGKAFDTSASESTAIALLLYAIGLIGQAGVLVLSRGFYALQDMRTPLILTAASVLINLIASMILVHFLQHGGLALAASLANLFNLVLFLVFLNQRLPGLVDASLTRFVFATFISTAIMGVISFTVSETLKDMIILTSSWALFLRVIASIISGIVTYFTILRLIIGRWWIYLLK